MKRYVEAADKFVIDNMKYGEQKKEWKVSDKITIGWEAVLPEPPENSSEFTKSELSIISTLTSSISSEQMDLIKMVDEEPNTVFEKMFKKYGIKKPQEEFKKAWAITYPIIMNLKWQFNRARPYQLAHYYDIELYPYKSIFIQIYFAL